MKLDQVIADLKRTCTAILYIAHGRGNRDEDAALIQVADDVMSWYLFKEHDVDFSDKFVALCVCEGYCEDMIDSIMKSHVYANTVVGSTEKLFEHEARAFFPAFYRSLLGLTECEMAPNILRDKVEEFNNLASNKMVTRSFGFSQ